MKKNILLKKQREQVKNIMSYSFITLDTKLYLGVINDRVNVL